MIEITILEYTVFFDEWTLNILFAWTCHSVCETKCTQCMCRSDPCRQKCCENKNRFRVDTVLFGVWFGFHSEFNSDFFSWNLLSFNVYSMSHLTYMHVHKQDTYTLIERNFVVFLSLQDIAFDVSRCASKGALWSPWTMEMNTTRRLWWRNSDLALPRRPDVCSEDYIEWLHRHARSN